MDMTVLRLLGLAGGILFLLVAARSLRRQNPSPVTLGASVFTGAALILVSGLPAVAGVLAEGLAVGGYPGSRLLALLMLAMAAVWVVVLAVMDRQQRLKDQLDLLIRHRAADSLDPPAQRCQDGGVLCVLPALNEADNLGHVLRRMPDTVCGRPVRCLVVDDGSTDGTAAVARAHGAMVARNPFPRGGGAALRVGFDLARELGAEAVVTIDADGQNDPRELPGVVRPVLEDAADVVIGSRILGRHEKTNWWRHLGVLLFSRVLNLLMGTRITDVSSGYRAIRVASLARLKLRQDQYHTSEFLVLAAKARLRLAESPITFTRRLSGRSKKGPELLYGLRFAHVLLTSWLRTS